jgi:iron complex transport system substrate-binding protein
MKRSSVTKHVLAACLGLALTSCCLAQRTVRDEVGRNVALPETPHRIISLAPSLTDMVYALGADSDLVGVSNFTEYPKEALTKPSVGDMTNPSMETILALHPDVVLVTKDMNRRETVDQLEKLGIPCYVVQPDGIAGIYVSVANLGNVLNRKQQADALVARLKARLQLVHERVKDKPAPRVFFVLWHDPVFTAGKHAFITELIETAGAKSVTDDLMQEWPQISLEAVVARKPDFLVLARGSEFNVEDLQKKSGWNSLEAVKAGRVFYTDDRIKYPSPAAFDALEDLANQFHPLKAPLAAASSHR